jgi:hypothetical protein
MKKIILVVAVCCAFCAHGIATNSDAKLKRIETLEKEINVLKAERANIVHKYSSVISEVCILLKKKAALKDKVKSQSCNRCNYGVCNGSCPKEILEKSENDLKISTLEGTAAELALDGTKINLNIDKARIELIKAEIKAGRAPEVPLEAVKAMIKYRKAQVKFNEARAKAREAKIKEKEAYIKYLEIDVEMGGEVEKIIKNTNDSDRIFYNINTHIEFAKLCDKLAKSELKFKQVKSKRLQAETRQAQAHIKFCKTEHKFYNTCLKFNKVIDEKNLMKFFYRD